MLFSDRPRGRYRGTCLHEVICQVRFPTILAINAKAPADFQETIRGMFPKYMVRQESVPAKDPSGRPVQVQNHHFISADSRRKVNLTQDFISLSTLDYPSWEDFARQLDRVLAEFIRIYQPAYFERVGLRYVNLISRKKLGLEEHGWTELISPAYCGPMLEEDAAETQFTSCSLDFTVKPDSSSSARVRSGPTTVRAHGPNAPQEPEKKFLLDLDLSMSGQLPCTLAAGALETLHIHAGRLFEGAITDTLRDAMER